MRGRRKMIKDTRELVKTIKQRICKKYGAYITPWPLEYQLKWLGGHKVKVTAWQEQWGATINEVEFIATMTKDAMRENENKLYEWIFNRAQAKKLSDFLYPTGNVYRDYERRLLRKKF